MTGCFVFTANSLANYLAWAKYTVVFAMMLSPLISHATPQNMGQFKITSRNVTNGTANGTYITSQGATGSFTIIRNETRGYNAMTFTPTTDGMQGMNGIEIKNEVTTTVSQDKFTYTFTITPDDPKSIHTIKIGQASYATTGNSEVARQTLDFAQSDNTAIPVRAFVKQNSSADYYYDAMGDYFMGAKFEGKIDTFLANQSTSAPQLRQNDSGPAGTIPINKLYYFAIPNLKEAGTTPPPPYKLTLNDEFVEFKTGFRKGQLPPMPTFKDILKSEAQKDTYAVLSENTTLAKNISYVSYGVSNINSTYVIAVENAKSVTLTYEGIMNGHTGSTSDVFGETYSEWISFGVEGTPNYTFSGKVFNDNGGINDTQADPLLVGGIYANNKFFNGILDTGENGITGSTIELNNCASPSKTVYAITTTDAVGFYKFILPTTSITGDVCITETVRPVNYPNATSSSTRTVVLNGTTKDYPKQDFGRVIDKNGALVLVKEQSANTCTFTNFTALTYSKNALTSSDIGVGADIKLGQCIAYKITAHNRANINISDIIVQDTLQEKGVKNANVTSLLALPERVSTDFTDTLVVGQNGTVKTVAFPLLAQANRSFYFNAQYGSTQSN
ncbi:hypothetical protein [Psychrobacter urativorans]|uniref:DUF11 domain-containing protein n=1 Tax=Psychrobacter urativorans TaxID=45610 RepID=A0A0M4T955_9GAMM|nr:hypothetical protein [Psychrobacter urativorans]ALF60534.1 hypothetical protein AOC03_11180 [Psychrobacter urativorans]